MWAPGFLFQSHVEICYTAVARQRGYGGWEGSRAGDGLRYAKGERTRPCPVLSNLSVFSAIIQ